MKYIVNMVVDMREDSVPNDLQFRTEKEYLEWKLLVSIRTTFTGSGIKIEKKDLEIEDYYTEEDFIETFCKRMGEVYTSQTSFQPMQGCLGEFWFKAFEHSDGEGVMIQAFGMRELYLDDVEMSDGVGGLVEYFSPLEVKDYVKSLRLKAQCRKQAKFAWSMLPK